MIRRSLLENRRLTSGLKQIDHIKSKRGWLGMLNLGRENRTKMVRSNPRRQSGKDAGPKCQEIRGKSGTHLKNRHLSELNRTANIIIWYFDLRWGRAAVIRKTIKPWCPKTERWTFKILKLSTTNHFWRARSTKQSQSATKCTKWKFLSFYPLLPPLVSFSL